MTGDKYRKYIDEVVNRILLENKKLFAEVAEEMTLCGRSAYTMAVEKDGNLVLSKINLKDIYE